MKKTLYILTLLFGLTNCNINDKTIVRTCCDKTYINVDDAINCLSQTDDGDGTAIDDRLLLLAFVTKDIETNQKLGWDIIKDPDIIKEAKKKYALVILDANQYKIPDNDCASYMTESLKNNSGKTFFVIANQVQCWSGDFTLDRDKESIIIRLGEGNGP